MNKYKLVPEKPTHDMVDAGADVWQGRADLIYKAMLDAAPAVQGEPDVSTKIRSISHGTMRHADLIPAFANELATITSHEQALDIVGFTPDNAPTDDDGFWDTVDAADILKSLIDALDSVAPTGCYFGAHPGDESDYGFWMIEELRKSKPPEQVEPVAWRWRKPVVNDHGETVGASAWEYGAAPGFLPWWPNEPLVRLGDYESLQAECDALRTKTSVSLGVGDGTGNLFVHGDYDSIKRVQELIFECEKLRKDAATEQQIQRAAQHLPEGWRITVEVEKDAGWIDIFNPDGRRIEIDGAGSLAEQIEQAIDSAMEGDKP